MSVDDYNSIHNNIYIHIYIFVNSLLKWNVVCSIDFFLLLGPIKYEYTCDNEDRREMVMKGCAIFFGSTNSKL